MFEFLGALISSTGCPKSEFEKIMIVQTHDDDEENGRFFLFFQKKNRNLHY